MKKLTLAEVYALPREISSGRAGWTKAKCDKCNTITLWNTKRNGLKCNDGKCAICDGPVKRTVWSTTTDYVVQE